MFSPIGYHSTQFELTEDSSASTEVPAPDLKEEPSPPQLQEATRVEEEAKMVGNIAIPKLSLPTPLSTSPPSYPSYGRGSSASMPPRHFVGVSGSHNIPSSSAIPIPPHDFEGRPSYQEEERSLSSPESSKNSPSSFSRDGVYIPPLSLSDGAMQGYVGTPRPSPTSSKEGGSPHSPSSYAKGPPSPQNASGKIAGGFFRKRRGSFKSMSPRSSESVEKGRLGSSGEEGALSSPRSSDEGKWTAGHVLETIGNFVRSGHPPRSPRIFGPIASDVDTHVLESPRSLAKRSKTLKSPRIKRDQEQSAPSCSSSNSSVRFNNEIPPTEILKRIQGELHPLNRYLHDRRRTRTREVVKLISDCSVIYRDNISTIARCVANSIKDMPFENKHRLNKVLLLLLSQESNVLFFSSLFSVKDYDWSEIAGSLFDGAIKRIGRFWQRRKPEEMATVVKLISGCCHLFKERSSQVIELTSQLIRESLFCGRHEEKYQECLKTILLQLFLKYQDVVYVNQLVLQLGIDLDKCAGNLLRESFKMNVDPLHLIRILSKHLEYDLERQEVKTLFRLATFSTSLFRHFGLHYEQEKLSNFFEFVLQILDEMPEENRQLLCLDPKYIRVSDDPKYLALSSEKRQEYLDGMVLANTSFFISFAAKVLEEFYSVVEIDGFSQGEKNQLHKMGFSSYYTELLIIASGKIEQLIRNEWVEKNKRDQPLVLSDFTDSSSSQGIASSSVPVLSSSSSSGPSMPVAPLPVSSPVVDSEISQRVRMYVAQMYFLRILNVELPSKARNLKNENGEEIVGQVDLEEGTVLKFLSKVFQQLANEEPFGVEKRNPVLEELNVLYKHFLPLHQSYMDKNLAR